MNTIHGKLLIAILLLAPLAKADSFDTFTFADLVPAFTVPANAGPKFSKEINGTKWSFFFTEGDHYPDVDYTDLYVTTNKPNIFEDVTFGFPYYCAPWNTGCTAVGKPFDVGTGLFVPGDYGSMTIVDPPGSLAITTPEPPTWMLVLAAGAILCLKKLWTS